MRVNVGSLVNMDFRAQRWLMEGPPQKFPSFLFPNSPNPGGTIFASLDVFCLAVAGKFDRFFFPRQNEVPAMPQRPRVANSPHAQKPGYSRSNQVQGLLDRAACSGRPWLREKRRQSLSLTQARAPEMGWALTQTLSFSYSQGP